MRYEVASSVMLLSFWDKLDLGIQYMEQEEFKVTALVGHHSRYGCYLSVEIEALEDRGDCYLYWSVDVARENCVWRDINLENGEMVDLPEPVKRWLNTQPLLATTVWSEVK